MFIKMSDFFFFFIFIPVPTAAPSDFAPPPAQRADQDVSSWTFSHQQKVWMMTEVQSLGLWPGFHHKILRGHAFSLMCCPPQPEITDSVSELPSCNSFTCSIQFWGGNLRVTSWWGWEIITYFHVFMVFWSQRWSQQVWLGPERLLAPMEYITFLRQAFTAGCVRGSGVPTVLSWINSQRGLQTIFQHPWQIRRQCASLCFMSWCTLASQPQLWQTRWMS